MSRVDEAVAAANDAVAEIMRDGVDLKRVKVRRFGRHRDGYLHAYVDVGGVLVYVSCRWGSWQIPTQPQPDLPDYAEPLRDVVAPYTYMLSEAARRWTRRELRESK